jgi:nanoRNase/pAp phosphatase (c-di-AMP/oligoRNAs hydrolase)
MDLTPKQQTSEAIRQADNILVTTGQHPSVDQVAAVIGLTMILRKFGKKVTAVISDTLPQSVSLLETSVLENKAGGGPRDFVLKVDTSKAEVDKLRYEMIDGKLNIFVTPFKGNFAPSDVTFDYGEAHFDFDLAIILGVPNRGRIDRVFEQNPASFENAPVVNIDFHRSNENYGAVNLIEPNASSLSEILVALSESLQGGLLDDQIATAMLMGIVASTDRFTASHTTAKSLTVAAQMMAAGARQQSVVRALYKDGKGDRNDKSDRNDRSNRDRDRGQGSQRSGQQPHEPRDGRQAERQSERQVERQAELAAKQIEPAPRQTERERTGPAELPIIAPSHIELMPEAPAQLSEMPAVTEVPASQPAMPPVPQPAVQQPMQPAPTMSQVPPAQVQPNAQSQPAAQPTSLEHPVDHAMQNSMPVADFAAAAEILGKRPSEDYPQTDRG